MPGPARGCSPATGAGVLNLQPGREEIGNDDILQVIFHGGYGDLRDYQVPLGDPIRRQRPAVFVQVFTANGEPPVVFGNGQPPRDTAAAQEVIALAFTFDLDSQFAPGDPGIAEPRLFLTVKAGQDLSVQQDFAFVVPGRLFPGNLPQGHQGEGIFLGRTPAPRFRRLAQPLHQPVNGGIFRIDIRQGAQDDGVGADRGVEVAAGLPALPGEAAVVTGSKETAVSRSPA